MRSWVGTDSQPHDGDAYLAFRGPPRMSPGLVLEGVVRGRGVSCKEAPPAPRPPLPAAFIRPHPILVVPIQDSNGPERRQKRGIFSIVCRLSVCGSNGRPS